MLCFLFCPWTIAGLSYIPTFLFFHLLFSVKLPGCINGLRLSESVLQGQEKAAGARRIKSKAHRRRHSAPNLVPVRVHQGNTRNAISKRLPPLNHTCLTDKATEPSPALQRGCFFPSLFLLHHPPPPTSRAGADPHGWRSILCDMIIVLSLPIPMWWSEKSERGKIEKKFQTFHAGLGSA